MAKLSSDTGIEALLSAQRAFFASGATSSLSGRREALEKLEKVVMDRRDDLLDALQKDLGKPGVEAYLAEYYFLLQELRLVKKSLKKWLKPRRVSSPIYFQPCRTEVRLEPFGQTLVIAPWNYPIQLALSPIVAALAAGNTVILKPSELSSASQQFLVEVVAAAFPPEHVAVVTGDAGIAGELLDQPFDFVFFTGSTAIGKIVAKKAAEKLAPNILELGGKCPCVVDSEVNIEMAAKRILAGKFFNGGQTCFAPDFVAVHESVKVKLIEAFKTVMANASWSEEMAHILNDRHYDRLLELTNDDDILQGEDDRCQLRLAPRIQPNANWDDRVMEEEIFGPILPVVSYADRDELIGKLSAYGSPLALYIFSEGKDFPRSLLNAIRSGGVCINDTMKQGSQLNAPFGGVGDSGYGRYRGRAGVEALSYERIVVKRSSRVPEMLELMPPYGDKLKWLKRFLR